MKELNFEVFLKEHGVDTELFYRNCKKKYQKWDNSNLCRKRKELKKGRQDNWLYKAFKYEESIQFGINWGALDGVWVSEVNYAIASNAKITF